MAAKKRKKSTKKKTARKGIKRAAKKIVKEKDVAMDLAQRVHEKFDRLVRASILFGSQAKGEAKSNSDIDIIFIIDDASIEWDLELISWYREELGKIITKKAKQHNRDFHVNTVKLTTWWQDLIHGDPVIINILRFGDALVDSGGFFIPMKSLLLQGKIRSTPEAAYAALQRAPGHLARSKLAEASSIEGVYWTMVDSAHAALITAGKLPPSPEHMPQMLKEAFVDAGMLKMNYVSAFRDIYTLHKSISHGEVFDIKGVDIDNWQKLAEEFLTEMTRIIDSIIGTRKGKLR